MPNWTEAQQNAINASGSNILVSAAAGSGKTAVLVERVVKKITDYQNPVDVDKLLIVTFTNAAAAEMKNRILKSLNAIISERPNDTNAIRQMSLLPNAKICTIDSFCINLVRENFFKLDISQDFKILDNSEQLLVEQNAADEIIESFYEENREEFKSLVELLSTTKNDDDLAKAIKRVNQYLMSQPFPMDWLDEVIDYYNPDIDIENSVWKDYVFDEVKHNILFFKDIVKSSISALSPDDEMYDKYQELLNSDLALAEYIESKLSSTWDDLKAACDNASFASMPRAKKGYVSESKDIIFSNRDICKKIVNDDVQPLLCATGEEYKADCTVLYPILKTLSSAIKLYNKKMLEIKKDMNAYSFSDIEHFAINLLFYKEGNVVCRTELAEDYENTFDEILVDEYQDTNTAQDMLFEMLSNGSNRFMVGDVKQSIYRFRLAMPQIFNKKKDSFDNFSPESDSVNQKIILDKNFRSRSGICSYTNFMFSLLMSRRIGELDYNKEEYLNCGADYQNNEIPSAQIKIIETPQGENADEYEAHQMANFIVNKINSKEQIKDGDSYRNIRYSDIAVLFRTTKNRMPVFSKVFSEYGIPVISNNKTNLFENNEISILVSFLRVIDNPIQDIPLLATLMSVFYGYSADDIARAKVKYNAPNLYSSICNDKEHFCDFINDLEKYRKYASSMTVESFLRQLISDTSFLAVISAMGNCEQRRLNVLKFIDIAKKFDSGENVGLTSFMRYVDSIINSKLDFESVSVSHVGEDCVTLLSVHQSKGLEFPVCIFAGTSHKYNTEDLKDLVQLHPQMGIGFKVHNEKGLFRYNSVQYSCIKNMNACAGMSENLRVLYVALTRAKEQFISFISLKDPQTHCRNLSAKIIDNKINANVAKHISSDADFILLCALLHGDAKILREFTDKNICPVFSDFKLSVDFLNNDENPEAVDENEILFSEETVKKIKEKLSFKYSRCELSTYSSKRAASSLDEKEQNYKFFAKTKPAFLNEQGMTAAEKGTAMHAFMQYCNYENAKDNLKKEIERLTEKGFISQQQADSLNKQKLKNLFASDFAKRMFSSEKIYREIKVSSFVPVNELEDTEYTDNVLIQGIADCVFEENGELVLVDYKTDKVKSENELISLYKNQISFYKKAVSKTLKMNVKEALLYSFSLDKECICK